jgi:triacylglycerol esterase/lipase EstA (alpha/beta hydrolase family)
MLEEFGMVGSRRIRMYQRSLARVAVLFCAVVAVAGSMVPVAAAYPGPPLQESEAVLADSLTCPESFDGPEGPVLLVHATTMTAERNWSSNYGRVLPGLGYDVCTVELVDEATADIQLSAERVVYAIRTMAERSGRKVQVIGHSQGPLEALWAIKWWPDIAKKVDDLIGIAAPYHGWRETDVFCEPSCVPALWQMKMESNFVGALTSGDETPGRVSYTSVYTQTDELVQPFETAELDGGSNIAVQEVCPGRVVEHIEMVFDAAVYALVLDALAHPGPADPSRFDGSTCLQRTMPGTTQEDMVAAEQDFWSHAPVKLSEGHVDSEPPVADYAGGAR